MLYRAVGRVLLVLPSRSTGAAPVIPALDEIRDRRRKGHPAYRATKEPRPARPPHRRDTVGDAEMAKAMRPRPGFDTDPRHHNPFALFELYIGPAREFSRRRLADFLGVPLGAIPCR